ncbi:MAG: DUF1257 domain-containing protein [Candidatus Methanospirareceae archaeon]
MSHISVFNTRILNPNPELVREVMEALAKQYGAQLLVNQTYKDRYGTIHADYILVLPSGRGIGVKVGEKLEIVGDPYGWEKEFQQLQQQIVQTYVHFALLQQFQRMGYQLQNVQQLENGVIMGEVIKL